MAPKLVNPIEVPPSASSDEEEDVTSSGEEEEEGSSSEGEEEEEPQTPLTQKNPPPKNSETATPSVANEESGSDSDSESESESESDTPKRNAKPIATKSMVVKAASSTKRPAESSQLQQQEEAKEAKRPKKKATEEEGSSVKKSGGEDAKKNIFQRLFSEEDEIALLKGMLDYSAKKGTDPIADMNAFFEFVKKSIHTDVTKAQVMDKIRRLKKKFENNACKGKEGEDPNFSKPHEFNAFKLSKKIWGKEGISGKVESSVAKSNGKAKGNNKAIIALKAAELVSSPIKRVVDGGVKVDGAMTLPMEVDNRKGSNSSDSLFDKRFDVGSLEEEILKHGFNMVDAEKKAALEARWRNLQIRELELFVERNEMLNNLAKSMLESCKSEDK